MRRHTDVAIGGRAGAQQLPAVDHHRSARQLPHQPAADVDQVHQRTAAGRARQPQAHLRRHVAGPARLFGGRLVAGAALHHVLPAHGAAGAAQVRHPRLEPPVRVQSIGSGRQHPVRPEPPRRHGPQEGRKIQTLLTVSTFGDVGPNDVRKLGEDEIDSKDQV